MKKNKHLISVVASRKRPISSLTRYSHMSAFLVLDWDGASIQTEAELSTIAICHACWQCTLGRVYITKVTTPVRLYQNIIRTTLKHITTGGVLPRNSRRLETRSGYMLLVGHYLLEEWELNDPKIGTIGLCGRFHNTPCFNMYMHHRRGTLGGLIGD